MRFAAAVAFGALSGTGAAATYSRDVAPILYRHCAPCHRPGQSAPFALLTFQDAAGRAKLIAAVTANHTMPPWKPVAGYGNFAHARGLSAGEIGILGRWAAEGAPIGDGGAIPAVPKFPGDWKMGMPDLMVTLPKAFTVPADGPDLYQCFVVPLGLSEERYVRAIEFRPGNALVVHHALLFTDTGGSARRIAGGGSYSCFGTPGFLPTSALGGWSPGNHPIHFPRDAAGTLHAGADVVIQIHFHPSGKAEEEQSRVGFYFTSQAPTRRVEDVALTSRNIDIAPGDTGYKVRDHFTLPIDVHAIGIIPHAHYLCRDMKGTATLPNGSLIRLLWIRDWDFNWQDQYEYATPVALPEGTRIEMEFTYDNSAGNPHNPSSPPKRVVWGAGTRDEMAGLHLQVVPDRMEDLPELGKALWGKVMRSVGGEFYKRPDTNPVQ